MIDAWRVGSFKKFGGKKEFSLSPLTILSGINSSGKSSLLQSILLVKQTVMSASPDRVIALNGPLVQLGAYSDVYNPDSNSETEALDGVSFGWTISRREADGIDPFHRHFYEDYDRVTIDVDFRVSNAPRKKSNLSSEMYPTLIETSVGLKVDEEDGTETHLHLALKKSKGGGRPLLVDTSLLEGRFDPQEYLVSSVDEQTKKDLLGELPRARLSGGSLQNFLPDAVAIRYDRAQDEQAAIKSMVLGDSLISRRRASMQIGADVVKYIKEYAAKTFSTAEPSDATKRAASSFEQLAEDASVFDFHRSLRAVHPSTKKRLVDAFKENSSELEQILASREASDLTLTKRTPSVAGIVASVTSDFFRFHVHYVGPLRDEPKPIYSSRQISSSTDVGPRGEFTAAVLSLNEQTVVSYFFPEAKLSDNLELRQKEATLPVALADWLDYLGVASDVSVSEKGSLGYELKVRTQTDKFHRDLTNVGVGVSQILPVLITVLLAAPSATILLEQPELHLHPSVQSRLGDFFLAASRQGKQVVVETHSEHIIERLRLRIAQEASDTISLSSSIYFFDNSANAARRVEISKYGAIIDWPDGFFDESSDQTSRILEASMKKKIASKKSKRG